MKKTKLLSFVLAAAMLAIPLAGCSQDEGADGGKETIKIGGLAPLSGDVSQYGVAVNNAVKMAVEDINAKGGILGGRKIEYIVTDEKGDSTEAVNAYNALMDQEIVALIGDVTSKPCKAVAAKAAADNMPMLTPSGTDADITKAGKNVFRACFIDPYQGQLMANYAAKKLNAKTAAILYDSGDPYSTGIADAFEEAAKKEGMEVTNKEGYASKSTDFKTQLTKIKGKNPDVLLIPVYYGDVALIVDQIQQQGITSKLLGADGWDGVASEVAKKSDDIKKLLSALVLATLCVFLKVTGRSNKMIFPPLVIMLCVTFTALVQRLIAMVKAISNAAAVTIPAGETTWGAVFIANGLQLILAVLLIVLGLNIVFHSFKAYKNAEHNSEAKV